MTPEEVKYIVVHCSATTPDMDIGAQVIDAWHIGRGWSGIGYHGVIRRDGALESGRELTRMGAHVRGHNSESVGICLVGGLDDDRRPAATFTAEQYTTLKYVLGGLVRRFPGAKVVGHHDLNPRKSCPCFDVQAWWEKEQGA